MQSAMSAPTSRPIRSPRVGLAVLLLLVALGTAKVAPADAASQSYAQLRVLHAQLGAPALDVLVDGVPAVSGLTFGRDTGYLPLDSGVHSIGLAPGGQRGDR